MTKSWNSDVGRKKEKNRNKFVWILYTFIHSSCTWFFSFSLGMKWLYFLSFSSFNFIGPANVVFPEQTLADCTGIYGEGGKVLNF